VRRAGSFAAAVAVAATALVPRVARAGIEDGVGLDPRDTALAGSTAARPGSFSAVWTNPAGLARGGSTREAPGFGELSFGFVHARPRLHVGTLDGRPITPAAQVPDVNGLVLGARFDLGRAFRLTGLHAGIALHLPPDVFRWSIHPDERVSWLFWTDRAQHLGIHTGLGYRVAPWLSLGLGVRVLFDTETLTTGRVTDIKRTVDPTTGGSGFEVKTQLGEDVTVYGRAAPNAGVLVTPADGIALAIVYRHPMYVDDWGWTRIQGAPGTGDLGYVHRFAHYYQPLQIASAVSVRVTERVRASSDFTYGRWSDGLTTNHASLPGRFGDTLTLALGVSWQAHSRLALLGGYRFQPSPFDNLGGPTNLLDNDQHVTSIGLDADVLRVEGVTFALRAAMQVAWLVGKDERKDPRRFESDRAVVTNPGYPGYRFGGMVPAVSIATEVRW
jgi:hypothetical protein